MKARRVFFAAVAFTLGVSGRAVAEEPDATALFQTGRAKMDAKDLEGACAAFAKSNELEVRVGTLLNLAECNARLGRLTVAAQHSKAAVELASSTNDNRLTLAREQEQKLKGRIPHLTVTLSSGTAPGSTVQWGRVGSKPASGKVGEASAVDPGRYRIVVAAPSCERTETVELVEGESKVVEMGCSPDAKSTGGTANATSGGWSPWRTAGIVTGGAGVVGLAVGIGFGVLAIQKQDDAEQYCDLDTNECDRQAGVDLLDEGLVAAHVSTGMLVAGGVLAAGGLAMIIFAPSSESAVSVTAALGVGASRVAIGGTW